MADTKTLDEHAETVKRLDAVDARLAEVFGPRPESVRAVRDAYEAERAARVAARAALQGVADVVDPNGDHYFWRKKEADLAGTVKSIMEDRERIDAEWRKRAQLGMCVMDAPNGPECWCGAPSEVEAGLCLHHARELERLSHAEKAEARVRELEAERDALVKAHAIRERVFHACAKAELQQRTIDLPAWRTRADKAEADLAETRAQLARLREAGSAALQDIYEGRHTCPVCDGGDTDDGCAHETDCGLGALEAALSDPGPTLAEIRRAASDFREIRPSVDGDLDAAVDRAQAEGRVLDFPALVRLCMDPQVDTLIYAITEAGAVFLFSETCVRKEVAEIRRAAQVEVLREMAGNLTPGWASEWVAAWLRQRADDVEAGRG